MELNRVERVFFLIGERKELLKTGCLDWNYLTVPERVWGVEEYCVYFVDGKEVNSHLLRRLVFGTRLLNMGELVGTAYARHPEKKVTLTKDGLKALCDGDILIPVLDDGFIEDCMGASEFAEDGKQTPVGDYQGTAG